LSNLTVKLTFDLGRRRFASGPVGSNRSAAQPLAIHRSDRTFSLLQNKLHPVYTCYTANSNNGTKMEGYSNHFQGTDSYIPMLNNPRIYLGIKKLHQTVLNSTTEERGQKRNWELHQSCKQRVDIFIYFSK